MIFKPGKYYKHTTGNMIHICGYANSHFYGEGLVAEDQYANYSIVGSEEENAVNHTEITREEFENTSK